MVPLKGGRWHIIPQLAVYTTYIPLIVLAFWRVICYLPPFRGTRNNHWFIHPHRSSWPWTPFQLRFAPFTWSSPWPWVGRHPQVGNKITDWGWCIWIYQLFKQMPSPKLTASLPLKIDAWKTILCFWEDVFSGVMLVSGRVWNYGSSTYPRPPRTPPLKSPALFLRAY